MKAEGKTHWQTDFSVNNYWRVCAQEAVEKNGSSSWSGPI